MIDELSALYNVCNRIELLCAFVIAMFSNAIKRHAQKTTLKVGGINLNFPMFNTTSTTKNMEIWKFSHHNSLKILHKKLSQSFYKLYLK